MSTHYVGNRCGTTRNGSRRFAWFALSAAFTSALMLGISWEGAAAEEGGAAPSPEADVRGLSYQQAKARDVLTFDFMLSHPEGKLAEGVTPEERDLIQKTLAGGCAELLASQHPDGLLVASRDRGYAVGAHALYLWALLACGEKPSSPPIRMAIEAMTKLALDPPTTESSESHYAWAVGADRLLTYDTALVLMAYHAVAEARLAETPGYKPPAILSHRTAENHTEHATLLKSKLSAAEVEVASKVRYSLLRRQKLNGHWFYLITQRQAESKYAGDPNNKSVSPHDERSDDSNAHFAMLGLLAAFRIGLGAPPEPVLMRAANEWLRRQILNGSERSLWLLPVPGEEIVEGSGTRSSGKLVDAKTRGWGYSTQENYQTPPEDGLRHTRLSMSAAGIICLTSIRHMLLGGATGHNGNPHAERLERGILDGLAHLSWRMDIAMKLNGIGDKAEKQFREANATLPLKDRLKGEELEGEVRIARWNAIEAERVKLGATRMPPGRIADSWFESAKPRIMSGEYTNSEYPNDSDTYGSYTMLAVERAGILTGCDFFGNCEWYPYGARDLLKQLADYRLPTKERKKAIAERRGREAKRREDQERKMREARGGRPETPEEIEKRKKAAEVFAKSDVFNANATLAMQLLFLKGFLDKTPTGPVITGGGKPIKKPQPPEKPKERPSDAKPADPAPSGNGDAKPKAPDDKPSGPPPKPIEPPLD